MRVASRITAISRGLLIDAQRVEDRIEVADLRLRRGAPSASRRTPPRATHGRPTDPAVVARARAAAIAGRWLAEHFGAERRVDRRGRRAPARASAAANSSRGSDRVDARAPAPRRRRARAPGPNMRCSRRSSRGCRNSVVRLRAAVDHARSRAARRRRSGRRTGCSAGTACSPAARSCPAGSPTPSPIAAITRARRPRTPRAERPRCR